MIIGSQTLEGKVHSTFNYFCRTTSQYNETFFFQVSEVDRPLLVIRKTEKNGMNGEKNATVNAVVTKKLVFKTRPRPLVISTVV